MELDLSQQTAIFAPFTASKESDSADAQAIGSTTPPDNPKSQNGPSASEEQSPKGGAAAPQKTVSYDLFIGADGFWSRSRAAFEEQVSCSEAMVGSEKMLRAWNLLWEPSHSASQGKPCRWGWTANCAKP